MEEKGRVKNSRVDNARAIGNSNSARALVRWILHTARHFSCLSEKLNAIPDACLLERGKRQPSSELNKHRALLKDTRARARSAIEIREGLNV